MSRQNGSWVRRVIGWLVILGVGIVIGFLGRGGAADQPLSSDDLLNGYALLYELMSEESQVDDLLIIKSPGEPLPKLLKSIAATAAAVVKEMDQWKAADPTLGFKNPGLPRVEVETRSSIASMRTEQLLFHGGAYFEDILTETQASATNYAWHLAKILAKHEPDPTRAKFFAQWRDELKTHAEAMGKILVFSPPKVAADEADSGATAPSEDVEPSNTQGIQHRHRSR